LKNKDDFELDKINIATTTLTIKGFQQKIITNINTIDHATDCCMASSYIPFVTGIKLQKINNYIMFDGGFKKFPPPEIVSYFDINPYMWKHDFTENCNGLLNIKTIKRSEELFESGYCDSEKNKDILDKYFL